MSLPFTRTPTGIVGKWHFHMEPTIWVEGSSDIYFYLPLVDDLPCRIEAFHGRDNARALIEGLKNHDFPYIVLLDGDYDILRSKRNLHKRVIRLRRYSFENYLWEKDSFNRSCLRHAQCGDRSEICHAEFDRMTEHLHDVLLEAIVFDVAARDVDPAPKVLPDRIDQLLSKPSRADIDSAKVAKLILAVRSHIPTEVIDRARLAVEKYLREHRLVDLLRGHLLFGLLRLMFTKLTTELRGTKVIVNDDTLTQLLSEMIWHRAPSPDHQKLKISLRKSVRSCLPWFPKARV
jgi:hypothetical protein